MFNTEINFFNFFFICVNSNLFRILSFLPLNGWSWRRALLLLIICCFFFLFFFFLGLLQSKTWASSSTLTPFPRTHTQHTHWKFSEKRKNLVTNTGLGFIYFFVWLRKFSCLWIEKRIMVFLKPALNCCYTRNSCCYFRRMASSRFFVTFSSSIPSSSHSRRGASFSVSPYLLRFVFVLFMLVI